MSETAFRYVLAGWGLIAIIVFIVLFFVSAPYGRHFRRNFGPSINAKLGWILMESPAPLVFSFAFLVSIRPVTAVLMIFFLMWEIHYFDRSFVYPLTIRLSSKPLPVSVMGAGIIFNTLNAYLNVKYLSMNSDMYSVSWLLDIRFLTGIAVFISGFIINRHSDYILYRVRHNTTQEYGIPQAGFYRWVSCPNYLGEILIWIGWTVTTWSPVAAAFSLWSIANLAPRAKAHHRWYKEQFEDYPEQRRILVPWLW